MRILALDYGSKTVGLAITDALGYTVLPYSTLWREREGKLRKTVQEICDIVLREYTFLPFRYPTSLPESDHDGIRPQSLSDL